MVRRADAVMLMIIMRQCEPEGVPATCPMDPDSGQRWAYTFQQCYVDNELQSYQAQSTTFIHTSHSLETQRYASEGIIVIGSHSTIQQPATVDT